MRWRPTLDLFVPVLALALFLAFSLHQLELPGLYYDEALDAVPAMQLAQGQQPDLVRGAGLTIAGHTLPLMAMDYVGPVNTYLLVPFFALLGAGVVSARLMTVAVGALTILLYYLALRRFYGRGVASVTVLLLAVSPSFIFWTRQGIHVTSVMTAIAAGSLLALLHWWRARRTWSLCLGCFLLGLGITAKLLFLWYVVALGVTWLVLFALPWLARGLGLGVRGWGLGDRFPTPNPQPLTPNPQHAVLSALFLVVGGAPLILYNVQTQGTLEVLGKNLRVSQYGVNNLDVLHNLGVRLDAFRVMLLGSHFWFLGGLQINRLYPIAFVGAVALLCVLLCLSREARKEWRKLVFPLLFMAIFLLMSVVTVSSLEPTHLLLLLPLPQVVIGVVLYLLYREGFRRRGGLGADRTDQSDRSDPTDRSDRAFAAGASFWQNTLARASFVAALLVVLALIALDIRADVGYHIMLARTGGVVSHSDAVYRLARYLDEQGGEPLALDWGIRTSVQLLTQGRIGPLEVFFYQKDTPPAFVDWMYGYMTREPARRYIFHADDMTVYPRRTAFLALAEKIGKTAVLEQEIRQRDGRPVYLVYMVR